METSSSFTVACFGETLWDVTPHGSYPGGAPLNVAYHLHKLGVPVAMISRVGIDKPGQQLIDVVDGFGLSTEFFQLDYQLATSRVLAHINSHGDATYDILHPVAWDAIDYLPGMEQLVQDAPYFLFGTLAARSKTTRETLLQLISHANTKVLDINLRPPYINRDLITQLLSSTDILKLNIDELELITGWFSGYRSEADRLRALRDHFSISTILLTRGKNGAVLNQGELFLEHPGFRVPVADTVGSGDAFTAAMLRGIMQKQSPVELLTFANQLAAYVTTCPGACPPYTLQEVLSINSSSPNINQNQL